MNFFTLNGWRTSAANGLVEAIPLQTFDAALLLVDEYIATAGGWLPNDQNDPTGEGVLLTSESPSDAIGSIVDSRLERVYRIKATMDVKVDLDFIANFDAGQSDSDILAQIQPLVETFVQQQLSTSPLAYGDVNNLTGTVATGGELTTQERLDLESALVSGQTLRDPLVVAVRSARSVYGLDNTWSVKTVYTEPNKPIVAIIRKYQTSALVALEQGIDKQYVINVNPDTYNITGGVISPIDLS